MQDYRSVSFWLMFSKLNVIIPFSYTLCRHFLMLLSSPFCYFPFFSTSTVTFSSLLFHDSSLEGEKQKRGSLLSLWSRHQKISCLSPYCAPLFYFLSWAKKLSPPNVWHQGVWSLKRKCFFFFARSFVCVWR